MAIDGIPDTTTLTEKVEPKTIGLSRSFGVRRPGYTGRNVRGMECYDVLNGTPKII